MPFTEFYGATFGPNRQPRAKAKILWGAANTQLGPYRVSIAARHGRAGALIVRIQLLWEGFTEGMNLVGALPIGMTQPIGGQKSRANQSCRGAQRRIEVPGRKNVPAAGSVP